ncbi:MAG TPA: hypothetical protein PK263_01150 [bacterium]|nr:hypothetical protein [bacterium]
MHTHYKRGTPLYIILKNGGIIEGKFHDHGSGHIVLEGGQKVEISEIRSVSIRRLKADDSQSDEKPKIQWRKDD